MKRSCSNESARWSADIPQLKKPRKLSPERVRKSALYYLSRRPASREQLRRVLRRRADRSRKEHGGDRDEMMTWIEDALDWCERLGYLDDAKVARDRAKAMRRRGASTRAVRAKLHEKGIAAEHVDAALGDDPGGDELRAALRLLRRRKMGPWSRVEVDAERKKRELGVLGRAGYGYEVAKRAREMPLEEAEGLLL